MQNKKIIYFVIFALISSSSFGSTLTGFCFSSNVNLSQVKAHLSTILAPRDKVFMRESVNCVELAITPTRVNLFRSWLKRRYRITDEYSVHQGSGQMQTITSQQVSSKHCKMELLRTLKSKSDTTRFGINKNGSFSKTEQSASGETKSNLMLLSGKPGSLKVDDLEVSLTCQYKTADRYVLEVNIKGLDASLMTSVEITRGQKVNIGDIVQNINRKNRQINSNKIGVDFEKTQGSTSYNYFLSVK